MTETSRILRTLILTAAAVGIATIAVAVESTVVPEPTAASSPRVSPEPSPGQTSPTPDGAAEPDSTAQEDPPADLDATRAVLDQRIQALADRIASTPAKTPEFDAIDADLRAALIEQQLQLRAALDAFEAASGSAGSDLRWARVELHGEGMRELVELRKKARSSFTRDYVETLTGLGRIGLAQAAREARTATLAARYHLASRRHTIDEVPQMARDLFTVGAAFGHLLLVLFVLTVALWIRRRWREWLERLRTSTFRSLGSVGAKRRAQRLFRWCEIVTPWTLFLATIAALVWALGPVADSTEVRTVITLLAIFGCYRLTIDIVAAFFVGAAKRYGLSITEDRRSMLLRSIRLVLRIATFMVLIHLGSRALGQGFLGATIVRFAWLVVIAAVLIELYRWRDVMIDTFLQLRPNSKLAATLGETRTKWYGAFLAPAAFVWLAGHAVAAVARDFALGFDQTQKALAFLFRQRVQRQAEKQGYAEGDVAELPEGLIDAFAEEPMESGPLVVPIFPGLADLHEILSTWRETGARGSFLLTGERGIGKTTWLNQIRREDLEIQRILLGRRVTGAADLCTQLAGLLGVDAGPDAGPRELGRSLYNGPQRVVVLDMAQHLFLASVGGYEAFGAFATLVNRTCNNVFWLCSMSGYAWRHLRSVRPDATVFRTRRHLTGWSEDEISALIQARCAASDVKFNYADLVVDRLEGV